METKSLYLPKIDPLTLIMMGVDCACTFQTAIYPKGKDLRFQKNSPKLPFVSLCKSMSQIGKQVLSFETNKNFGVSKN